jgi:hypothetical protein
MTDAVNSIIMILVVVMMVIIITITTAGLKCLNRGGVGASWLEYLHKSVSSCIVPECTFSQRWWPYLAETCS